MLKEFKDFIMTGNVIDFAVAVIMAGAMGAVINGFVSKIAMPLIGLVTGGVSFYDKFSKKKNSISLRGVGKEEIPNLAVF